MYNGTSGCFALSLFWTKFCFVVNSFKGHLGVNIGSKICSEVGGYVESKNGSEMGVYFGVNHKQKCIY